MSAPRGVVVVVGVGVGVVVGVVVVPCRPPDGVAAAAFVLIVVVVLLFCCCSFRCFCRCTLSAPQRGCCCFGCSLTSVCVCVHSRKVPSACIASSPQSLGLIRPVTVTGSKTLPDLNQVCRTLKTTHQHPDSEQLTAIYEGLVEVMSRHQV